MRCRMDDTEPWAMEGEWVHHSTLREGTFIHSATEKRFLLPYPPLFLFLLDNMHSRTAASTHREQVIHGYGM
jgi:hypothetical protein